MVLYLDYMRTSKCYQIILMVLLALTNDHTYLQSFNSRDCSTPMHALLKFIDILGESYYITMSIPHFLSIHKQIFPFFFSGILPKLGSTPLISKQHIHVLLDFAFSLGFSFFKKEGKKKQKIENKNKKPHISYQQWHEREFTAPQNTLYSRMLSDLNMKPTNVKMGPKWKGPPKF